MRYIEIKSQQCIFSGLAKDLVKKKNVIALVTTGKISAPAKKILDEAGIAWAENVTEKQFQEKEAQEI